LLDSHLQDHPGDAKGLWLRTEAAMRLSDWPTAQRCARVGMALAPDLPQWRLIEAYLAWNRRDLNAATAVLKDILSDDPRQVEALCLLGDVHHQRRDPVQAKACYESALQADPGSSWARARLGGNPPEFPKAGL
jgi:cytochrome c-type biogenesis protein CcmH/NrfG